MARDATQVTGFPGWTDVRTTPSMLGLDLFCGAGGMSLGARAAGIETVLAVEADRHAAKTYAANHKGTTVFAGDIRKLSQRHLKEFRSRKKPAVVFGGPPCQGFSYSNLRTRSVANDDNWLFREFVRVVKLVRPEWVVFENVIGIINTEGGRFVDEVTHELESLDYTTTSGVLNAMHFGVPQDRSRFFLIASQYCEPSLPARSRRPTPTVWDAISDLPRLKNGASKPWMPYSDRKPSAYARRFHNGMDKSPNHLVSRNSDLVVRRYKHIPTGGNWEDIPAKFMRNYADRSRCHTGIYRRLRAHAPSVVIGNYRKNMLIHPTQHRGLSVREAARIQSFPDAFEFHGSIGFQQQQVGNAVPPLLAEAVFRALVRQNLETERP